MTPTVLGQKVKAQDYKKSALNICFQSITREKLKQESSIFLDGRAWWGDDLNDSMANVRLTEVCTLNSLRSLSQEQLHKEHSNSLDG